MIKIKKHNATVSVGRAELLHFKNFTEQYGHFSGPKTMRKIALFRKRNNESSNSTKSLLPSAHYLLHLWRQGFRQDLRARRTSYNIFKPQKTRKFSSFKTSSQVF